MVVMKPNRRKREAITINGNRYFEFLFSDMILIIRR